jgi:hypothetical protein
MGRSEKVDVSPSADEVTKAGTSVRDPATLGWRGRAVVRDSTTGCTGRMVPTAAG